MKTSKIEFEVTLDDNLVPETIDWKSDDQDDGGRCNATLLAVWDAKEQTTLRIDLWTKEMRVDEMKKFTFQTLLTMADSFARATGEEQSAQEMRDFAKKWGEKLEVIQPG